MKKGYIHKKDCAHCASLRGKKPWNTGLTKDTSLSVKKYSDKLVGQKRTEAQRIVCGNAMRGKKHSAKTVEKLKQILSVVGVKTQFKKGDAPWNSGKKLPPPWNKGIHMPQIQGENHPRWKGGINNENIKIRKSLEYKLWRESVFKRDNFTCIWCGDNRGGNLEADHIKPFACYPSLRFAIDNGRTLCRSCHKKTDTYAGKGVKRIKAQV